MLRKKLESSRRVNNSKKLNELINAKSSTSSMWLLPRPPPAAASTYTALVYSHAHICVG